MKQIRHGSPTILLIDLDIATTTIHNNHENDTNIGNNNNNNNADDDDDDTVYTPSCSSSCSTASSSSGITDSRITWIKKSCHTLSEDVPVIGKLLINIIIIMKSKKNDLRN